VPSIYILMAKDHSKGRVPAAETPGSPFLEPQTKFAK